MDHLKVYETIDSTNNEAQRLLAKGPVADGFMIIARHQSSGKGQYGRTWYTEPGNSLAMSIIVHPPGTPTRELAFLSMKVSLAVVNALAEVEDRVQCRIKWPNDIYAGDKKLCGLLIENVLSGAHVLHSVIGVGVNVNEAGFPAELPNAVSLKMLTGNTYEGMGMASIIRRHILAAIQDTTMRWKPAYDRLVYGLGRRHAFTAGETLFQAEVKGISDEGNILLQADDGAIRSYASHEVRWVRG